MNVAGGLERNVSVTLTTTAGTAGRWATSLHECTFHDNYLIVNALVISILNQILALLLNQDPIHGFHQDLWSSNCSLVYILLEIDRCTKLMWC